MGLARSQRDVVSSGLIKRVSQGRTQVLRQHYNQMEPTRFLAQGSDQLIWEASVRQEKLLGTWLLFGLGTHVTSYLVDGVTIR